MNKGPRALLCRLSARIGFACIAHRENSDHRQLLVDVSTIARRDAGTGIQRVVRALWLQLKSLEGPALRVTPIIGSRRHGYRVAPTDFLDKRLGDDFSGLEPVMIARGDIFLGLDLAAHILPYRARDLRRWKAHGVDLAFVVYDLLPALHPHWFSANSRRNYLRWINVVMRQADHVICIAEAVKCDLEGWIKTELGTRVRVPKLTVMRLSGDMTASNPSTGLPADAKDIFAWASAGPTILMVGTIEPRKGYDQALMAFEQLWAAGDAAAPQLLIVGRPGWMTKPLQQSIRQHREHGRRLVWIDNASDEYLEGLYTRCHGLLFASRAEGFGLPLLEAASHGKPALARDLPVFREFAPTSVTFFSSDHASDLAASISNWMKAGKAAEPGPACASLVSWPEAAGDVVAALGIAQGHSHRDGDAS